MKKIFLITLLIISVILIAETRFSWGREDEETGTTTASYVTALSLISGKYEDTTFIIKNTGADSTMYYKVLIYANTAGDLSYTYVTETSIAVSTTEEPIEFTQPVYGLIVVQVKDNSGHTTYEIEWIQRKTNVP